MSLIRDAEERIAKQCIRDLLDAGFSVSVNDGEFTTLSHSRDADAVFAAMFTADEDYLIACDGDGERVGWVRFIYGNDGWDVINDYTTNLETALARTNALAEEMSS